jgi:hypothetical protein
LREEL